MFFVPLGHSRDKSCADAFPGFRLSLRKHVCKAYSSTSHSPLFGRRSKLSTGRSTTGSLLSVRNTSADFRVGSATAANSRLRKCPFTRPPLCRNILSQVTNFPLLVRWYFSPSDSSLTQARFWLDVYSSAIDYFVENTSLDIFGLITVV
jgi:hypothetical protein